MNLSYGINLTFFEYSLFTEFIKFYAHKIKLVKDDVRLEIDNSNL